MCTVGSSGTGNVDHVRPGQGALRLSRTLLVAVSSAGLSAAAHALAGGCVTTAGVVTTCALLGATTWTQLSRERSARFLVGWLTVGQLLGHGLLEVFCRTTAPPGEAASLRMLGLHALAVAATALLLGIGERRIWSLARRLAALASRLRALGGPPLLTQPLFALGALPTSTAEPVLWSSLWCSPRPVRRGPPCAATA